jgi:transketolase
MLVTALSAGDLLQAGGISAAVVSVPTVQPFSDKSLQIAGTEARYIATVEEHAEGGLATVVAERIAFGGLKSRLLPFRLRREPVSVAGSQDELRAMQGLSPENIAARITQWLQT